ncbi:DUF4214 domain-containing protein [Paenibacillus hamazuiensis]|uniref:DUF4214 domain-containing protein n=1 Tax=Paenibacillus hamazuiensis TaxID=2936508 RepID=UPI00200EEB05|nr:DUF4214 domain-containing protein [Paenibacillus hamazuiensis]
MIQMLHKLFHIGSDMEYIEQLYWELLHRDPDPEGRQAHAAGLKGHVSRMRLFEAVVLSEEAADMASRFQLANMAYEAPTIGTLLHKLLQQNNEQYVIGLYRELLCREPDPESFARHTLALASGDSRLIVFCQFAASDECMRLLSLPSSRPLAHKILAHILSVHRGSQEAEFNRF